MVQYYKKLPMGFGSFFWHKNVVILVTMTGPLVDITKNFGRQSG